MVWFLMNQTIKKNLVLDEDQNPVGVFISYKDWLYIEKLLFEKKEDNKKIAIKNVGGILRKYANPALIELEKDAWSNHVLEKYASS